jgi:N-hydroxyarylamine O-acetyltransferase
MEVSTYLERIAYEGPLEPSYDTLQALHARHLLAIPFENLDIHLGRPILLDEDALFRKIVIQRRGGFCYELNGLFAALLRELGFSVTCLSARVARADGCFGPDFDHLALAVGTAECGNEKGQSKRFEASPPLWLADVGYGDSFQEPLCLYEPGIQQDPSGAYRIEQDGTHYIVWQRAASGPWHRNYCFVLRPRRIEDFLAMGNYHQTSPASPLTQKRICTRATPSGRITLSDTCLAITEDGQKAERPVNSEAEYQNLLKEHFGLDLMPLPQQSRRPT